MKRKRPIHTQEVQALAARAARERLQALRREIPGTRSARHLECLHQMRVASRRLRSVLGIFEGVLGKSARRWRREIRSLTGTLGAARDLDVQIDFVSKFLATLEEPDLRLGPKLLLGHLREERCEAQVHLNQALDGLEASGLLDEMRRELRPIAARLPLEKVKRVRPLCEKWARDALRAAVKELLRYRRYVNRPECTEELHEMRIAAKRLRYTLEAFAPQHRKELESALAASKTLQELLGDIHDCDVWVELLGKVRRKGRLGGKALAGRGRPLSRIRVGLEHLEANRARRRKKQYRRFLKVWKRIEKGGEWKQLRKALRKAS